VSLGELLRTKSSEYELLAEWHAERAPLDDEHFVACQAMAVVGWSGSFSGRSPRQSTRSGASRQTRADASSLAGGDDRSSPPARRLRLELMERLSRPPRNCHLQELLFRFASQFASQRRWAAAIAYGSLASEPPLVTCRSRWRSRAARRARPPPAARQRWPTASSASRHRFG
jgi:hypothetical protein